MIGPGEVKYDKLGYIIEEEEGDESEEEVICPYCGRIQSSIQYPVSYWGTEEDYEKVDCEACGKTFNVRETVTRTYETFKNGGE